MKVIITTLGSIGDVMPFLAVADALRARQHECFIASNAGYGQLVQGQGFSFTPIWDRGQQNIDDVIQQDPVRAWEIVRDQMFVPAIEPTFRFIEKHSQNQDCAILSSWTVFGAAKARAVFPVKLASAYLSPYPLTLGIAELGASDARIGLFPSWFSGATDGVQLTGFPLFDEAQIPPLPPDLERFLQNGDPAVIFTPGSFMRRSRSFFLAGLQACETLGLRSILLTPYMDQVPSLSTSAIHFRYIPLDRLAPRCAAIVHHGGIGTAAQGLRAGIPQLLMPLFYDQFDNAARLEKLGVGRIVVNEADAIKAGLSEMLSVAPRGAAMSVAQNFRADTAVRKICEIVESLA